MNAASAVPPEARPIGGRTFSLRERIFFMRVFVISGAIFWFLGFLFTAYGVYWYGTPPPPPPNPCYLPCSGGLWWYQIVAIGILFTGVGILLALLGVAFKGPSKEWSEIPRPAWRLQMAQGAPGEYRCSACGASVNGSETVCPRCGRMFLASVKA